MEGILEYSEKIKRMSLYYKALFEISYLRIIINEDKLAYCFIK
jgi:hypothetical protein